MSYDLGDFTSEYLCPSCGNLLYVSRADESKEYCVTKGCDFPSADPFGLGLPEREKSPRLYEAMETLENQLVEAIKAWDHDTLARRIHAIRRILSRNLLYQGTWTSLDQWFACGELLLLINQHTPVGSVNDSDKFAELFASAIRLSRRHRFLEDLRTKRLMVARTSSGDVTFQIKYARAYRKSLLSLGWLKEGDDDSEDSDYVYSHLEEGVAADVPLEEVNDFSQILDTFWPVSLQLRTMFRSQYRTAQQYDYHPDSLDMSVLLGWCLGSWDVNDVIIPAAAMDKEIAELQVHFDSQGVPQRSAEN